MFQKVTYERKFYFWNVWVVNSPSWWIEHNFKTIGQTSDFSWMFQSNIEDQSQFEIWLYSSIRIKPVYMSIKISKSSGCALAP